jgi:hypothetical protein
MKKNRVSREVASLRRAAFHVGPRDLGSDALLEQFLAQIVGGIDPSTTSCTEFTCNLYAPPPPPSFG